MGGDHESEHQINFFPGVRKRVVRLDGDKFMGAGWSIVPHDAVGRDDVAKHAEIGIPPHQGSPCVDLFLGVQPLSGYFFIELVLGQRGRGFGLDGGNSLIRVLLR